MKMKVLRENVTRVKMHKMHMRILAFFLVLTLALPLAGSGAVTVSAATESSGKKMEVTNVIKKSKTLYIGSSFALKANQAVKSYASSNPAVAEVDEHGVIYAKKKGAAKITVTGNDGKKVKIKVTVKKAEYYSVSKKAGTYSSAIKVKIRAKKGYKVYYTTSAKFKTSKVIKSGKSKTLTIKKTKTLLLYAVKTSEKVTAKQLNKTSNRNKYVYYVQYQYTISKNQTNDNEGADNTGSSETGSGETGTTEGTGSSETGTTGGTGDSEIGSSETGTTGGTGDSETGSSETETTEGTGSSETETTEGTGSSETETTEGTGSSETGTTGETESSETKTEDEIAIQNKINEAAAEPAVSTPEKITVTPSVIEDDTSKIVLSSEGVSYTNLQSGAVTCSTDGAYQVMTIHEAGTYVLTGGTQDEPITNFVIVVNKNITEEVNLIWDQLVIDNSALGTAEGEDIPVFSVGKSTPSVNITLKGTSVLTGNGSYTDSPQAVIYASDAGTVLTFAAYEGDDTAGLTVIDAMDSTADYGDNDPSDGIFAKGTLVLDSGTFDITANGDCLKGTGKGGAGGVQINGGTITLHANLGNAIKSKNGNIVISAGTVQSVYTAGDGIQAKNYGVFITGGKVTVDNCYGDGIQGENVFISGDDTVVDIKTYFENAGLNYYNTSLGSGNYNTLTTSENTKTEVVNVDTGSHKGIKGGTKACTYSYQSVEDGSDYTAGTTYTKEASGGIVITGGTITVDTTNTGIKYNGSTGGSQGRPGSQGSSLGSSGNLSAANSDGQYIIGSPDDAIHSNYTCIISGGTITLASADDGITAPGSLMLINGCDINISECYEGIEGGEILIGSSDGAGVTPSIIVYSNDDGVNAASDASVTYIYADESEEQYTKTRTSSKSNVFQMLDGYLNIMIGDNQTHSFSLSTADGTATTGTYTSDGDGIDCNGSFYAYGGTIVVYGPNSGSNSPIDMDDIYYIGSGVTLLAVGSNEMAESPDTAKQAVLTYSGSGNFGMSAGPGNNMGGGSASSLSANTPFAILDASSNVILAIKPIKEYSYVLYSSPELKAGASYRLYSGGSVSGSLVWADGAAYDYRYTEYSTSGASVLSTVSAS